MKKIFFVSLLLFSLKAFSQDDIPTASLNSNDLQITGLKGRVKSVLELAFNNDAPENKRVITYYN